jgi:HlyD family secretion protein
MKKVIIRVFLLALLAGAIWGGYALYRSMPKKEEQIATARVRRGDVVVRSYARGELRAVRSTTLIAPNLFGTVQITRLAPLGSLAREKDLIVEFDDSEVNSRLEEKQLEIDQIDEQIKKAEADLNIRRNQDQVELLSANYSVRRSELEVKRNELLPEIDQKKNLLNLEESKRRLKQLESDIKSRLEQAEAEIAVLREKKRKAVQELARERVRLSQVKLLSPMSGLVAIKQNRPNFMFPGMQIPDLREGDQVQPGVPVADILDLSELELVAKVGELDRANLKEGQEVKIHLDAIADKNFSGRIKSMSGTASANIFSSDPAKKFDVIFSIDMKQLLSALGAKPEQVAKVLAAAEQNRRKPIQWGSGIMLASTDNSGAPAGPQAGQGAGQTAPGGAQAAQGSGQAAPGGAQGSRTAVQAARPAAGAAGTRGSGAVVPAADMPMSRGQFSEKELAAAELPPAPEADSNLEVLIRPGLLADVEIILEKVPNAIHIPAQAVFEKDGRQIVWVKNGRSWDEREVKPLKRTESTMIIASGIKPGEVVALSDPNAKPGDKKKEKGANNGAPMALPGGGAAK